MVDSDDGYGCFASVWSFAETPRASEPPSGAQDISEASVIPEMRGRIGKGKEEEEEEALKKKKKKSPRTEGKAKKRQNRASEYRT